MSDKSKSEDIVIRIGTPDDLDALMQIAMMATEENGFLDPNPAKLAAEMWPALHQDHGIVGIIGPKDGQIEGAVLLRIGDMIFGHSGCRRKGDLYSP